MSVDQTLSTNVYRFTKNSWILRPLAIFCATTLLFVMMTALMFSCSSADCVGGFWKRIYGNAFFLGIPLFATWFVTFVLQKLVKRARPFEQGRGEPLIKMVWVEPSLPSVHASVAFATAVVGFYFYADLFGPWLFLVATTVALGRVAVGVHYFTDILFGAFVGFVIGSASLKGLLWFLFVSHWF